VERGGSHKPRSEVASIYRGFETTVSGSMSYTGRFAEDKETCLERAHAVRPYRSLLILRSRCARPVFYQGRS